MIPEEAIEDATQSIFEDDPRITESDAYDLASNALEAALPHLEAVLRKQIAADIKTANYRDWKTENRPAIERNGYDAAMMDAARIAEEGNPK